MPVYGRSTGRLLGGVVVAQADLPEEAAPPSLWSPLSEHAQVRISVPNAKATAILIQIARVVLFASRRTQMYQFLDVVERTTRERIFALTRRIFKCRKETDCDNGSEEIRASSPGFARTYYVISTKSIYTNLASAGEWTLPAFNSVSAAFSDYG